MTEKIWTIQEIQTLLNSNNPFTIARAIVAIYNRQTFEEKEQGITKKRNNVGFNAFDAQYFTRPYGEHNFKNIDPILRFVKNKNPKDKEWILSRLDKLQKRIWKYSAQLTDIANSN